MEFTAWREWSGSEVAFFISTFCELPQYATAIGQNITGPALERLYASKMLAKGLSRAGVCDFEHQRIIAKAVKKLDRSTPDDLTGELIERMEGHNLRWRMGHHVKRPNAPKKKGRPRRQIEVDLRLWDAEALNSDKNRAPTPTVEGMRRPASAASDVDSSRRHTPRPWNDNAGAWSARSIRQAEETPDSQEPLTDSSSRFRQHLVIDLKEYETMWQASEPIYSVMSARARLNSAAHDARSNSEGGIFGKGSAPPLALLPLSARDDVAEMEPSTWSGALPSGARTAPAGASRKFAGFSGLSTPSVPGTPSSRVLGSTQSGSLSAAFAAAGLTSPKEPHHANQAQHELMQGMLDDGRHGRAVSLGAVSLGGAEDAVKAYVPEDPDVVGLRGLQKIQAQRQQQREQQEQELAGQRTTGALETLSGILGPGGPAEEQSSKPTLKTQKTHESLMSGSGSMSLKEQQEKERKEEEKAAISLQSRQRQRLAMRESELRRKQKRQSVIHHSEEHDMGKHAQDVLKHKQNQLADGLFEDQIKAATRIQAIHRGKKEREAFYEKHGCSDKAHKDGRHSSHESHKDSPRKSRPQIHSAKSKQQLEEEEEIAAATRIQAIHRGNKSRKGASD